MRSATRPALHTLAVAAALVAAMAVAGCDKTVRGIGQDASDTANAVQDSVE